MNYSFNNTVMFVFRSWRGWSSAVQWWTATHRSEVNPSQRISVVVFIFPLALNHIVPIRLPSSVSSFARWTTWRRLKLFRNRTGTTQQDTSNSTDQQQPLNISQVILFLLLVMMPWTRSTTTSGTSPSWSTSLVSFIDPWGIRYKHSDTVRLCLSGSYEALIPRRFFYMKC